MSPLYVLGISCWYHDSAVALIRDGEIVAAAQEERFSRIKNDEKFPEKALTYCLSAAAIELQHVNAIVFYEKPILKFDRIQHLLYFPYLSSDDWLNKHQQL